MACWVRKDSSQSDYNVECRRLTNTNRSGAESTRVCHIQQEHTIQPQTAELWIPANGNHLIFSVIKAKQRSGEATQRLYPTNLATILPELKIARRSIFCCLTAQNGIFNVSLFWYRWQVIKLPWQTRCILSRLIHYSKANWIMRHFIFNSREAKSYLFTRHKSPLSSLLNALF